MAGNHVPLASKMLSQDGDEALERAIDGAMDDDRTLDARLARVLEAKVLGQLEVELDRGALMAAAHGVRNVDVDLGAVEGAVSGIQLPLEARGIERRLELLLGAVPVLDLSHELLLGARRELQLHMQSNVRHEGDERASERAERGGRCAGEYVRRT